MSDSDSSLSNYAPFKMQKSEGLTRKRKRPLLSSDDSSSDDDEDDGLLSIPKHRLFLPNKKTSKPDRKKDIDSDSDNSSDSDDDDSVLKNMKVHSRNSWSAKKKSLNKFDDSGPDNDANANVNANINANVNANDIKVKNNQTKISSNNGARDKSAASNLKAIITLDSDDDSDDVAALKIQRQEYQATNKSRLGREALLRANIPIDLLEDDEDDDYEDERDAIEITACGLHKRDSSNSNQYQQQDSFRAPVNPPYAPRPGNSNRNGNGTNHPSE
eukprot:scaffold7393_cov176-Chaetoceros_neogracile.AAC.1